MECIPSFLAKLFIMLQVFVLLVIIRFNVPEYKKKSQVLKPIVVVTERVSRLADDGHWFSQTSPFPLHVYSAFFDNRTSLLSVPQIVIISQFYDSRVDRCVLWLMNNKSMVVPGAVTELNLNDRMVVCPLPANLTLDPIHIDVSLAWADTSAANGVALSSFRVPVEVLRRRPTRGRLALCLSAMFQSSGWSSRQVVEWLEMQRLLGVERIVVYNQSMSHDVGRVFTKYSRREVDDNKIVSSRDRFVEIRQTRGPLVGVDSTYGHQTSTINDCMYRNIGSFEYIAVIDFDELIVPRQNFTTIPELIDNLTSSINKTIASFVFRNAHFFEQTNTLLEEASMFLSRRSRAAVSPRSFVIKSIIDADACVGMWVHVCKLFTKRFREKIEHDVIELYEVDEVMALKHHYRDTCNLDHFTDFYSPGSCDRARRSPVVDGVIEKYGAELTSILSDRNRMYNV